MNGVRDVAVLVGSLRKESFTRKLAIAMKAIAPAPLSLEIVEIRDLDLYNPDLEANVPPPWLEFRDRIRRADDMLFTTPEYNRSVPGLLKNAIDVGSRPTGRSGVAELFDADGKFAKETTRQFVEKFLVAFAAWIETTRRK